MMKWSYKDCSSLSILFMGACFSSNDVEQLSIESDPDEIDEYSTEDEIKIPTEQGFDESVNPKRASSVVVTNRDVKDLRQNPGYSNLDCFTFNEMRRATLLFKNQVLGEGGFGVVYKGIIDDCVRTDYPRTEVAIKKLKPEAMQGDKEWLAEVNYLGRLRHPNVVNLIGYCCEAENRLLVYEYMAEGCLADHLYEKKGTKGANHVLPWSIRMKIALDAARGLAYLHDSNNSVIYRDFKSSNILLDADFNAKLSDFGIAKDGPVGDKTHITTQVVGTNGYTSPEYARTGKLRASTDIYAFGAVLLELMTGLPTIDKSRAPNMHNMTDYSKPLLHQKNKFTAIIDPRLKDQCPFKNAFKVAKLVHKCLHPSDSIRPLISEIVEELESIQTR